MIGIIRKVESLGPLIFLNVLPTGVGWFAAMVMAFMLPRREPPLTYVAYQYPLQYQQAPRGNWLQQLLRASFAVSAGRYSRRTAEVGMLRQ
jgi:hypothetical protein